MNVIQVVKEQKNPKVLVVTPLLPGHKISKETKKTITRNDTPFVWLSSEGNFNIPTNADLAIQRYENDHGKLPKYYLMIDRDISLGRNMIDRLVNAMDKVNDDHIAFAYASFEFKGYINQKFPARPYDINYLIQHNYISSNSLFRMDVVREVGLVKDENFKRLLDWAFLLKLFYHDYIGMPVPTANFVAQSTENDISAGSQQDYQIKRERVLNTFGVPIIEKFKRIQQQRQQQQQQATQLDLNL